MVLLRLPHRSFSPLCLLTLAFALIYRLPVPVSANYEHYCDSNSFRNQRSGQCGETLANTVLNMCRALSNSFLGKYIMKRVNQNGIVEKRLSDITLSKSDAFSYLSKRQVRQNIVCECCVNACTFTELYQYCELPPLAFKRKSRARAEISVGEESSTT